MLKFDESRRRFEKLAATEMKAESVLERRDLQQAILHGWDLFKNEIGLPSAFLVGDEINPHQSTQNAIDILAYDPDTSSLVVIELKRDRHKLHLLQALSYAAMVSKWDNKTLISNISRKWNPEPEEFIELASSGGLNQDPKIVLVAEYFDPEVILTADWLASTYAVDISAFSLAMHKLGDQTILALDQRYPLKDLADVYEVRRHRRTGTEAKDEITWEAVIPKLDYSFAKRGIELCSRIKAGEPARRRFGSIRTNFDGFSWLSINFRRKYINVYIKGDYEGAQEQIRSHFQDPVNLGTWRDGFSFAVESERQFEDLVGWLKLSNREHS